VGFYTGLLTSLPIVVFPGDPVPLSVYVFDRANFLPLRQRLRIDSLPGPQLPLGLPLISWVNLVVPVYIQPLRH